MSARSSGARKSIVEVDPATVDTGVTVCGEEVYRPFARNRRDT